MYLDFPLIHPYAPSIGRRSRYATEGRTGAHYRGLRCESVETTGTKALGKVPRALALVAYRRTCVGLCLHVEGGEKADGKEAQGFEVIAPFLNDHGGERQRCHTTPYLGPTVRREPELADGITLNRIQPHRYH